MSKYEGGTAAKPAGKPVRHEYGSWQRPPGFNKLRTEPGPVPHGAGHYFAVPREGRGDYKRVPAGTRGRGVQKVFSGDHLAEVGPAVWRPIRNDLPVPVPYGPDVGNWRTPGWERRAVKAGLDLDAIAAADAELDALPQHERESVRKSRQPERLADLPPVLTPASKVKVCARLHCDNKFVPAGPNHKYCSHGCRAYGR